MADSRLADIYRKELKTKGLLGAFVSASGARLKEKTDIRGLLPQTGVSGAAFEKMFGKRYKYGADKQTVRSAGGSDTAATKSMEEKLTRIGVDMKIMAKNSVVLPAMARDMNLMRMNMQKMVKLSGGTPSTKSDMFFKRASDREAQYEGQFKKSSGGLTPTPVGEKKEGGGFFDIIKGFLSMGIGPLIESILGGLFKAGLLLTIMNGIGKYFTDKEFRESVNNAFDKFFTAVFGEDYKRNLTIGAATLIAAMVGLEAAFTAAAIRISRLGGGLGLPNSGPSSGPGGKGGRGGWLKTLGRGALAAGGVALLTEGVKYYLQQGESEADAKKLAQEDIDNQTRQSLGPGEEIAPKKPEGMRGSEIADRTGSALNSAITIGTGVAMMPSRAASLPSAVASPSPAASGKPLTSFGSVGANREMEKNKTLWEKIAKVMKKAYEKGASKVMLSKLGAKFGTWMAIKMATVAAGVIAAPFSAGASLLISAIGVGMLAKDVYDLYEWFVEYEKELDAFEKASTPTPVAADTTSVSASPTAAAPTTPKVTPGGNAKRGGNTSPTSSGGSSYAERIGAREAGGNYDTIFGKAGGAMINGKLVTENTIGEVGAWQADQKARKTNKQAAGKYQFMDVMSAAKLAGLGPNDLFNGPNQERMMEAYTESNAKSLRAYGLPDTDEYLSMAHAVGPKGAKKLIDAQNAGKGGANSLDVLGLTGTSASTNPQLNTSVNATIAALKGQGSMGHGNTALAKNNVPTGSTLTVAHASVMEQQYRLMGGGTTVINAPTNTSVNGGSSGGSGNSVSPYNGDLMRYLLRPIA